MRTEEYKKHLVLSKAANGWIITPRGTQEGCDAYLVFTDFKSLTDFLQELYT